MWLVLVNRLQFACSKKFELEGTHVSRAEQWKESTNSRVERERKVVGSLETGGEHIEVGLQFRLVNKNTFMVLWYYFRQGSKISSFSQPNASKHIVDLVHSPTKKLISIIIIYLIAGKYLHSLPIWPVRQKSFFLHLGHRNSSLAFI